MTYQAASKAGVRSESRKRYSFLVVLFEVWGIKWINYLRLVGLARGVGEGDKVADGVACPDSEAEGAKVISGVPDSTTGLGLSWLKI